MKILSPQLAQIVMVDDDVEECYILKTIFHSLAPHIMVTTLHDGNHLLEFTKHLYPDLLLLDMNLPGSSGLRCLEALKADPLLSELPVVVYSTTGLEHQVNEAYNSGASLYIVKPDLYSELVDTITEILNLNWQEPGKIRDQFTSANGYLPFSLQKLVVL